MWELEAQGLHGTQTGQAMNDQRHTSGAGWGGMTGTRPEADKPGNEDEGDGDDDDSQLAPGSWVQVGKKQRK